jgi:hypothetical protein
LFACEKRRYRLIELRAAIALASLFRSQRRERLGQEVLAPVYEAFTMGFDTPDLRDAKTLLGTSAGPPSTKAKPRQTRSPEGHDGEARPERGADPETTRSHLFPSSRLGNVLLDECTPRVVKTRL